MDIRRSFTKAEWSHVLGCLHRMKAGPKQLRLQCILELLVTSGIRLEELARARHKDLRVEVLPDLPETWILTVTGKRNKTREVPLQPEVVELIAAHGRDCFDGEVQGADQGNLPLIRTLSAPVPQWGRDQDGTIVVVSRTEQSGLALSASAIYAFLKSFFKRAAKSAEAAGLDARRFEKASTHWMRHTFVRQALVDGMPIEVASELAGHASISTTSIYSTQELSRKIKAIQAMKRRVLA
jgi:site-specific recombinase XerD